MVMEPTTYREAMQFSQPRPLVKKRRNHLRTFQATVDGDLFSVEAKTIDSAWRKIVRRIGQGKTIVVTDRWMTLSGTAPLEL
jgi:hypothetical protein